MKNAGQAFFSNFINRNNSCVVLLTVEKPTQLALNSLYPLCKGNELASKTSDCPLIALYLTVDPYHFSSHIVVKVLTFTAINAIKPYRK